MRVNVYGEELTDRIELVEKHVDEGGEVYTFYGVRFWLKFPNQNWWIHRKVNGEPDDDSSAVTIWSASKEDLVGVLVRAIGAVNGDYAYPEFGWGERGANESDLTNLVKPLDGEDPDFDSREPIDLSKTPEYGVDEARRRAHEARRKPEINIQGPFG